MKKSYTRLLFLTLFFLLGVTSWMFGQVFINQMGYLPDAPKYVFSTATASEFEVIDVNSGQAVFSGELPLFRSNDPATGMTLYRGDFSNLQLSGEYRINIGALQSAPFVIADTVYRDVYYKSLKSFYYQRCGIDLIGDFAGEYARAKCHQADGFLHTSTGQSGFRLARYSWHDAGDFGKYSGPAAVTAGQLLLANEYFPEKFAQDDLEIPESGNGVPDILDEARFALGWLLNMQDTSGGIYHKLTPENFTGFIMPGTDNSQRFIYQISSTATGAAAAALARGARLFSEYDSTFANQCLTAAQNAWVFLQANPAIVPPGGFQNPQGTETGQYGDGNDRDERLWAAAELFETTGETAYNTYFVNNYSQSGLFSTEAGWQNVNALALITYLYSGQPAANSGIVTLLGNSLDSYCNTLLGYRNTNGFHVSINPGQYGWGSNGNVLNRGIMLLFGWHKTGNSEYRAAALDQLHYNLGVNAHNISFLTGVGETYPMHIHHRHSEADNIAEPIPGLLAGGPNEYLNDAVLQEHFNENTPPALCYIDDLGSYASNEVAIYWNSPLVVLSGYFYNTSANGILDDPDTGMYSPTRFNLQQNYPNPFNNDTTIPFELLRDSDVELNIYNALGQIVRQEKFAGLQPGIHQFVWRGTGENGELLSSGTYHFELKSRTERQIRSMVLLK